MCLCPVVIKNPNWSNPLRDRLHAGDLTRATTDTVFSYLRVPCGHCMECLFKRQMGYVQRAAVVTLDHYAFFFTLTYNNESLPKVTLSDGRTVSYANYGDFQTMLKRIRKNNLFGRPFNYLAVTERGTRKGRPHFHGIFFLPKYKTDNETTPARLEALLYQTVFREWRRNIATRVRKKDGKIVPDNVHPVYQPLFTFKRKYIAGRCFQNFDLHYVTEHSTDKGSRDVMYYVTKYVFKPSRYERSLYLKLKESLPPEEFYRTWYKIRSQCHFSISFGAFTPEECEYVKRNIEKSVEDPTGFKFKDNTGRNYPLCRYYRRKFCSADMVLVNVAQREDGPIIFFKEDTQIVQKTCNFARILRQIANHDLGDEFEVLFAPDPIREDVANFNEIVKMFNNNELDFTT